MSETVPALYPKSLKDQTESKRRYIATQVGAFCPYCGTRASMHDIEDPNSDYGCSNCQAYVEDNSHVDHTFHGYSWRRPYPLTKTFILALRDKGVLYDPHPFPYPYDDKPKDRDLTDAELKEIHIQELELLDIEESLT